MKCPACEGEASEREQVCPTCGFPLRDLREAVTRVQVVAFALAFIPLLYAALLPTLAPVATYDPVALRWLELSVWGLTAFTATVLLLGGVPVLGMAPEEASRRALRHGLMADVPAVFGLLLFALGAPLENSLALVVASLLMFTFLVVRMPRLTAAMRWQMLVGFESAKKA